MSRTGGASLPSAASGSRRAPGSWWFIRPSRALRTDWKSCFSRRWKASMPSLAGIEQRHESSPPTLWASTPSDGTPACFDELRQLTGRYRADARGAPTAPARASCRWANCWRPSSARAILRNQGIDASHWADARTMLVAEPRRSATEKAGYLSATCGFAPDDALRAASRGASQVVITQGFIASDRDGQTVLLGRGGSDTSAAYLAAKLRAQPASRSGPTCPACSAPTRAPRPRRASC